MFTETSFTIRKGFANNLKGSTCLRLNLECKYDESIREKLDTTTVDILASLQRLEAKFNNISPPGASRSYSGTPTSPQTVSSETSALASSTDLRSSYTSTARSQPGSPYFATPHRVLVWPTVYSQLTQVLSHAGLDLSCLSEGGTPWLVRLELDRYNHSLPFDTALASHFVGLPYGSMFSSRVKFPSLTPYLVESYTNAYFGVFNAFYPILDDKLFVDEVLGDLALKGFGYADAGSVLALLVLALGQLVVESLSGTPIGTLDARSSGIRGGSSSRPPGLELFNEARARIGSIRLQDSATNVQIQLLQATYYGANACHMDFWGSTVSACMSCQVLTQHPNVAWSTFQGDLIKRAFWTCLINEEFYHLDMDLPRTNIGEYADGLRLPHFHDNGEPYQSEDADDHRTIVQCYFLAKIGLQRITARIHETTQFYLRQFETLEEYNGPPMHVIAEMSRQLDTWQRSLPEALRWTDEDLLAQAGVAVTRNSPESPSVSFTFVRRVGVELVSSELRARFYHARFTLLRPFIFKALHFGSRMSAQDVELCGLALKDGCLWPLALRPARNMKRLLPHLFTWTQNFISILLIFWISQYNKSLHRIYTEQLDHELVQDVTDEMLNWISDMKQIDTLADWGWSLLYPLYASRFRGEPT